VLVPGVRESATLLRLARLLRIVRIIRYLPDVRVMLRAVLHSLPPLFSVAILTSMVIFAYGMVGWLLFGTSDPESWGDIGTAMLTLFVLLTLENFPALLQAGMEIHPWSWVYFVSFVLIAAFIVLNVLIGIVLNSMEEAREIERRRSLKEESPGRDGGSGAVIPTSAHVAERIRFLRAALDELEQDLVDAEPPSGTGRR
jgi:voltage-gated sodium channel